MKNEGQKLQFNTERENYGNLIQKEQKNNEQIQDNFQYMSDEVSLAQAQVEKFNVVLPSQRRTQY